jgi:uncharacterized protein YjiS (DUF1127 family)
MPSAVQLAAISDPERDMADIFATRPIVGRWIARVQRWLMSLNTREVLRALDDATLKDIGLRRGDIYRAVAEMDRRPE